MLLRASNYASWTLGCNRGLVLWVWDYDLTSVSRLLAMGVSLDCIDWSVVGILGTSRENNWIRSSVCGAVSADLWRINSLLTILGLICLFQINSCLEELNLSKQLWKLLFMLQFQLRHVHFVFGSITCQHVYLLLQFINCLLFNVNEFSHGQFVFLQFLWLCDMLHLHFFFLFLQYCNRPFQVVGEKLQLVFNRNVLSNVSLVLLQLLLHSRTILLSIHAHLWHHWWGSVDIV